MDCSVISDALIANNCVPRGFRALSATYDKSVFGNRVVGEYIEVAGSVGSVTVAVSITKDNYDGRVWIASAAIGCGWRSSCSWSGWMPGITAAIKEGL